MLTKADFKKDQVVACKHTGNLARRTKGYTLGKVRSVGKFVTVDFGNEMTRFKFENSSREFLLENKDYGDFILFPSEQAYLEYEEKYKKLSEIGSAVALVFGGSNLSIDQVRRIYDIIHE